MKSSEDPTSTNTRQSNRNRDSNTMALKKAMDFCNKENYVAAANIFKEIYLSTNSISQAQNYLTALRLAERYEEAVVFAEYELCDSHKNDLEITRSLAYIHRKTGKYSKAYHLLHKVMQTQCIDDDKIEYAICMREMGYPDQAVEVLAGMMPSNKLAVIEEYAISLKINNQMQLAVNYLEKIYKSDSRNAEITYHLADAYIRLSKLNEFTDLIGQSDLKQRNPLMYTILNTKFYLDQQKINLAHEIMLDAGLTDEITSESRAYLNVAAKVSHHMRDFDSAIKYADKAKRLAYRAWSEAKIDEVSATEYINNSSAKLDEYKYYNQSKHVSPVFLIGFPRSGTSLLGRILNSHHLIHCHDEKPMINLVHQSLVRKKGYKDVDDDINPENARDLYWKIYQSYMKNNLDKYTTYVDKNPFAAIMMHSILQYFSPVKIIFLIRRPIDCTMSTYLNEFKPNRILSECYNLDQTIKIYDDMMKLNTKLESIPQIELMSVKYEELTSDTESTVSDICSMLGIKPDAAMLQHEKHTSYDDVHTPSYSQVNKAVYSLKKSQYKGYQNILSCNSMSIINKWNDRLGYH